MEIRQLRYFLDIAETEHLTRSAQRLFVTQSTLSHGLRQLEESLGVVLFDRLGRGLKLSPAGAAFRSHAQRALKEVEAGRVALADLDGLRSGRLAVGAFPTFLHGIAATVAAFNRAHPGVAVEVRSLRAAAIEQQLLVGELDLGVGAYPAEQAEIEAEPLFDERLVLVVGPGHAWARRRRVGLAALDAAPLALLPRSFSMRRVLDEAFRAAGVRPRLQVEMEPVESLLSLCRHDSLASIVPERAARDAPGLRSIVLHDAPQLRRVAGLLWRRGASRSAAAQAFAQRLREAEATAATTPAA
ncbi:LysR substrate-binding domain-containing protein [Piscinibacter sakaiensis]|uniref:Transcriptional regulator, LysR family n=1 Tax=Piscinibacter sakaiensis TaxID=1547922 RepID=A0A0K8NVB4_PISS1|nr:LysR substrate-binding domain-containing protein [Piscinibacter sakaiensis]GAP34318.1 transcriptional regulator, LysR family [Piscinibacter sakaiensis]